MSASCELLLFHTTQRCHSVFSCLLPLASFHDRLVASEKFATRFPPVADRTSGSLPRFPISVTLFKLRLTFPPGELSLPRRDPMKDRFKSHNQNHTVAITSFRHVQYRPNYCVSVRRRINASSTGRR